MGSIMVIVLTNFWCLQNVTKNCKYYMHPMYIFFYRIPGYVSWFISDCPYENAIILALVVFTFKISIY